MTIRAVLERKGRDVAVTTGATTVADVATLLARRGIGAVPIVDGDAVRGVFSERDIIQGLAARGAGLFDEAVEAVMSTPAITIDEDASVLAALSLMTRRRIRHLPVVAAGPGGQLVGLVSIGDLVKHRIERIEAEAEAMRSYIQGGG